MNNNTINFSGNKQKKKVHISFWFIVVIVIGFGCISTIAVLAMNNFNIDKVLGKRKSDSDVEETQIEIETDSPEDISDLEADNFLVICYDTSDDNSASFAAILTFIPEEYRIRVKPFDCNYLISDSTTLSKAFRNSDINAILSFFNNNNLPICRYAFISEANFINLIQKLGKVSLELNSVFEYKSAGITRTFRPGDEFEAEDLLNFLKIKGSSENTFDEYSGAIKSVIETFYTNENTENGDVLFTKLINFVKTDISAADYEATKSVISAFCSHGYTVTVNN